MPQDDIVHAQLTVREALCFTARLRTSLTEAEIQAKAIAVAKDLNLDEKLDDIIGSPESKTLSGGQRKRVNIALELICGTPVLFLDEPTSGLSSADADSVVELLKRLAKDQGKTIISTIHSPTNEALQELRQPPDARPRQPAGTMVYYGKAYPESIDFFADNCPPSRKEFADKSKGSGMILKILERDRKQAVDPTNSTAKWAERYAASKFPKQFIADRAGQNSAKPPSVSRKGGPDFTQWIKLVHRSAIVRYRDKGQLLIQALQAPVFASSSASSSAGSPRLLTVRPKPHTCCRLRTSTTSSPTSAASTSSWSSPQSGSAATTPSATWSGSGSSTSENAWSASGCRRTSSRSSSCSTSSAWSSALPCWPSCTPTAGSAAASSPRFCCSGWRRWSALRSALLISSAPFCKTTESAIALLPIVLLPMIGLGGGMKPLHKLDKGARPIGNVIATRWGFEGNIIREAINRKEFFVTSAPPPAPPVQGKAPTPPAAGHAVDIAETIIPRHFKEKGSDDDEEKNLRHTDLQCEIALAAMFLLCSGGVLLSLKLRDVN